MAKAPSAPGVITLDGVVFARFQIVLAIRASLQLIDAYAVGSAENGGGDHVKWEDIDIAYNHAKSARIQKQCTGLGPPLPPGTSDADVLGKRGGSSRLSSTNEGEGKGAATDASSGGGAAPLVVQVDADDFTLAQAHSALHAASMLVNAYAKTRDQTVDWEDVDQAHSMALECAGAEVLARIQAEARVRNGLDEPEGSDDQSGDSAPRTSQTERPAG